MSDARIPSPADFSLTWGDLELVIAHCKHHNCAVKALVDRFLIHDALARAWLAGLKEHHRKAAS